MRRDDEDRRGLPLRPPMNGDKPAVQRIPLGMAIFAIECFERARDLEDRETMAALKSMAVAGIRVRHDRDRGIVKP